MKRLEGIVEQTPFLNILGCAVYVVVAVHRCLIGIEKPPRLAFVD
jgi:hypothetical protein